MIMPLLLYKPVLQSLPHVTSLTILGCDMWNYIVTGMRKWLAVAIVALWDTSGPQTLCHFAGFAPCPLFERVRVVVLVDISPLPPPSRSTSDKWLSTITGLDYWTGLLD